MPEIEGHEFAPYVWAAWPVHVTRSNGASITAGNETEVADFLKGDPAAIAAHAARAKMQADVRAIEVKADADVAKIRADARAAIMKVVAAWPPTAAPVAPATPVPQAAAPVPPMASVAPQAAAVNASPAPGQLRAPVSTMVPQPPAAG